MVAELDKRISTGTGIQQPAPVSLSGEFTSGARQDVLREISTATNDNLDLDRGLNVLIGFVRRHASDRGIEISAPNPERFVAHENGHLPRDLALN